MDKDRPLTKAIGLDIGRVNTRASLFGISEGKYRLLGCGLALTNLGNESFIRTSIEEAFQANQHKSGQILMSPAGTSQLPVDGLKQSVDRVALTTSAGPWLKGALFGLTKKGSLGAGRSLLESMPVKIAGAFGLADLADEPGVIDSLIRIRPEIFIITGGEDAGAEKHVVRWVEVARLVSQVLPASARPAVLFAGNPVLEDIVRRRLEPITRLHCLPNLQPAYGNTDLVPAQMVLDREVLYHWRDQIPGTLDFHKGSSLLSGTKSFLLARMVRYLSRVNTHLQMHDSHGGVLAVDLGSGCTAISAGVDGRVGTVLQSWLDGLPANQSESTLDSVYQWTAAPVSQQGVHQYLSNQILNPSWIPQSLLELAISQAYARVRLQQAIKRLSENYPWITNTVTDGLVEHFESVIGSGSVLSNAPTPGQAMLILLDGLQPRGVTTLVLDRYHLLPLLGLLGEAAPILPVHVLGSDAFDNLGTVIIPVSDAPEGETLLTIGVQIESGENYAIDITQGTLRRLVIPAGVKVVLDIKPQSHTDVGFGDPGQGGRLRVTSGELGVVIDARGRPVQLPADHDLRIERLRHWLWSLGG